MARSYCPAPETCHAPKRGLCACQTEVRARMSAARKKAWADPDYRARQHAAINKAFADPEIRARISAARKKSWADPDFRARQQAAMQAGKKAAVPGHLKTYAAKLRRCGIRGDDLRRALEAAP